MTIFKVNINMNNAQAPSDAFEPLPPGEYFCEVLSAEPKPTSKPGRNLIEIVLRIEEPVDFRNRRIFDRRNLPLDNEGPETFVAQRLRELLDAIPGCFDFETGEGNTDVMVGQHVMVRTRNELDNRPEHAGELQTRVMRMYVPQDASGAAASAPAEETSPAPAPAVATSTAPAATAPKPAPARAPARLALAKPVPVKTPAKVAAPIQRSPFRRPAGAPQPQ